MFVYVSVLVVTIWEGKSVCEGQKSASCEVKLYAQSTKYFEICKEIPSACSILFHS